LANDFVIRQARKTDIPDVNAVCLKTGDAGRDATSLYRDPDLIGFIYAAPYLDSDGAIALVAEDEQGIVGYAVGAPDTWSFEMQLERDWWPELRKRYRKPEGDPETFSADQKRIRHLFRPATVPPEVVKAFPAHIHMNLLPRAQGRGIGSRLLETWLEAARSRHVTAVHAGVSAANKTGLAFWTARGFKPVLESPESGSRGTVWCGRHI